MNVFDLIINDKEQVFDPTELQNIERKYNISFAEAIDHTFTVVKSELIKELEEKQKCAAI